MVKKILVGTVVSNKSEKTVIVSVEKKKLNRLYGKAVTTSAKYAAHTEEKYEVGDIVSIIESRPISKTKKWVVLNNAS